MYKNRLSDIGPENGTHCISLLQLRKELDIGENSGMVVDFDPKKHLQELHRKYLK